MNRRAVLKYTSLMTGAAIGAPLMGALLSGCQPEVTDHYKPEFFQPEEFNQIKHLLDLILPKTDSPSATEVGVHQIIDQMVSTVYNAEEQLEFKNKFTAFSQYLVEADFFNLKEKEQLEFLKNINEIEDEKMEEIKSTYLDLRQQTIAYYLSTEEIGTKFLNYLPVPGEYQACISVEEVGGKAWAI